MKKIPEAFADKIQMNEISITQLLSSKGNKLKKFLGAIRKGSRKQSSNVKLQTGKVVLVGNWKTIIVKYLT